MKVWEWPFYKQIPLWTLLILLSVTAIIFSICEECKLMDLVKLLFASMILEGFALTYYQLKANHEWEKRKLAITESIRVSNLVLELMGKIDQEIQYSERKLVDVYIVDDIHKMFCCLKDDGSLADRDSSSGKLRIRPDKRSVRSGILETLNLYDYLSDGILNNVFDEEAIKSGSKGQMTKAYKVFETYIQHLRETNNRPTLYVALETIVKKWEDEDRANDGRNQRSRASTH